MSESYRPDSDSLMGRSVQTLAASISRQQSRSRKTNTDATGYVKLGGGRVKITAKHSGELSLDYEARLLSDEDELTLTRMFSLAFSEPASPSPVKAHASTVSTSQPDSSTYSPAAAFQH